MLQRGHLSQCQAKLPDDSIFVQKSVLLKTHDSSSECEETLLIFIINQQN